jgi:hypothetical protein
VATKAVIAKNEAIANTTRVQGFMGDCFVPRSDGLCRMAGRKIFRPYVVSHTVKNNKASPRRGE